MKNVHCQSKNAPMMYLNSCCLIFSLGYQNNISCSYDNCLILISLQTRYFTTQAQKSREKGESRNSSILTSILTSSSMIKRRRKNSSILAKSKLFFCFFLFSLKVLGKHWKWSDSSRNATKKFHFCVGVVSFTQGC